MRENKHKAKDKQSKNQQQPQETPRPIDPREDPELRAKNIRLFWFYLNSVLLPIVFVSVIGMLMSVRGITIENAESFPTLVVVGVYSVLIYLNFLLVKGFPHKWAHFTFGVIVPIGTFLVLSFFLR